MQRLLLLLLLIFASGVLQAQLTSSDELELRRELLRLVNELRTSKGLPTLQFDSRLAEAARFHSDYMAAAQLLSHEGKGRSKTPSDRVRNAGGNDLEHIGENILYTVPQEFPLRKGAAKALAAAMFEQWKNSPPHYANMIAGEYLLTDFGFAVDRKTNHVYATEVFGRKGTRIPGQLSGNAFGVTEGTATNCDLLISNRSNIFTNIGNALTVSGNEVLLYYHDIETIREVIDAPNDGLAADLIFHPQLACGKPNELDMAPVYDGLMLRPVYRDALFAGNRAESDYRLITPVGIIPDEYAGRDFSVSLIVIQNGQQCSYTIPVEIPSKSYDLRPVAPIIAEPAAIALKASGIVLSEEIHFDFKRNVSSGKTDVRPTESELPIERIDIISFSSVDGAKANNERLHNARAAHMLAQLHGQLQFPDSVVHINAMENWPKMRFQLKYYDMDDLARQPEDSIRSWLRANRSPFLDSLLFAQRRSTAVIHYRGNTDTLSDPEAQLTMNLRTAILAKNDALANKALFDMFYSEEEFQEALLFETTVFDALKSNPALVQNAAAALQRSIYSEGVDRCTEFLDAWASRLSELPPDARHNLLGLYTQVALLLLDEWDVPSRRLARVVHPSRFYETAGTSGNQSLLLNFHLAAIEYYGQVNDGQGISRSFDFIVKHFKKNKLSPEEEVDLVLFFNSWSRYDLTLELLTAHMDQADFSEDAAFVLAPTAAGYNDDLSEDELNHILEIAYARNPERWCSFIAENFQLRRYDFVKNTVCARCPQ